MRATTMVQEVSTSAHLRATLLLIGMAACAAGLVALSLGAGYAGGALLMIATLMMIEGSQSPKGLGVRG